MKTPIDEEREYRSMKTKHQPPAEKKRRKEENCTWRKLELDAWTTPDCHGSGWQAVPVHDPVVQDAANHAVKTIQQRSNSLFPYELREIVHAKAEVIEESAKFDMLLKVNKGDKEEKFKVEVHKNHEGAFHLNQMEPDHS